MAFEPKLFGDSTRVKRGWEVNRTALDSGGWYLSDILPKPSLIIELAKIADMICMSSKGICGEEDFWSPRLKEGRLWAEKAGGYKTEKS